MPEMTVDILYVHPDGTPDHDRHHAARISVKTWRGRRAMVKLYDADGRYIASHRYSRYARIDQHMGPPP